DAVELPWVGDPFECVFAEIAEGYARASGEILDGARDDDLVGGRQSANARRHVHGDAGDVVASLLDLPGVETGAALETDLAGGVADRTRRPNRARRAVERGEHAIARALHGPTGEPIQLPAHDNVVPVEQLAPLAVAELRDLVG